MEKEKRRRREKSSRLNLPSSRIRISGSLMRARAMAMRCFCPPDNCAPRAPTDVSRPSGLIQVRPPPKKIFFEGGRIEISFDSEERGGKERGGDLGERVRECVGGKKTIGRVP